MNVPVRLLILGTGDWANQHALEYAAMDDVRLVAAVDSRPEILAAFLEKHRIENGFASLDEALAWGEFDAASNVTPDAVHHATTLALLGAGKHVFCEKPLATSYSQAAEMAAAAEASGLVNMINLRYRTGAAAEKARQLVAEGAIGAVRHFEASYLQSWLMQPAWGDWKTDPTWLWRVSSAHGSSGVLGDIGIHILDFAMSIAGSEVIDSSWRLKTFDKAPGNRIGEYPLDANDSFVMHGELANGAIGTVTATRFAAGHHNDLRLIIHGDRGGLEVLHRNGEDRLRASFGKDTHTATWRDLSIGPAPDLWLRFVSAIREGRLEQPDFAHGTRLQRLLDDGLAATDASGSPSQGDLGGAST